MALTITLDESKNQIGTRLYSLKMNHNRLIKNYMVRKAEEMERYMKANHPWQNRTGAAEAGLSARLRSSPLGYSQRIQLSHGVPYGVYLEYGMERRFAIIEPTIRIYGPKIVKDLEGKLDTLIKVKEVY